jgi:hypothetical protein
MNSINNLILNEEAPNRQTESSFMERRNSQSRQQIFRKIGRGGADMSPESPDRFTNSDDGESP